jgi:lipopolysaccharide/colanic/teichoic acid biosynthesis glycosyltransferase
MFQPQRQGSQGFVYAGDAGVAHSISFTTPAASRCRGAAGKVKRAGDLVGAALALAVLALPLLMIALLICWDSPGPALFRQRRIGLHGRPFVMWKFRTMCCHAEPEGELHQACRGDPRVTRLGGWLRRRSIDEVPQLVNVLRGEMSLVGPRPHAPGTCAAGRPYEQISPLYGWRHRVRPGITGLAQVRGWVGETDTEDKLICRVDSDLEYIESWSLWLDLMIAVRTVAMLLRSRDVY